MFLLDTNVISELRKVGDGRADKHLVSWIAAKEPESFYISVITAMELETGVLRMERRDAAQGARLRAWLDSQVLPEFEERTLPIDTTVALACARLHVPDPRSERDALIAAMVMVHKMTVVTRNVADFEPTGIKLINPWSEDA